LTHGLSNKEIANKLFVTEKTVKFHLTNIYRKSQVKSRTQFVVKMQQYKDAKIQPVAPIDPPKHEAAEQGLPFGRKY
jgi:predicted ArsR family transcriptional regulator